LGSNPFYISNHDSTSGWYVETEWCRIAIGG
jgi:hypothetical protein